MNSKCFKVASVLLVLLTAPLAHAATDWSTQDYNLYPGDFNGDGKTDMLYIAKDPLKLSGIATSDGTAPNTVWQTWYSNYLNIDWSNNHYSAVIGDFNGDGKADIFLQRATAGDSYLLLTDNTQHISSISQTVASGALGLNWSADQHKIVAGDFTGDGKADLFLQATSTSGINAIVAADGNGQFTAGPTQSWSDTQFGFNWSTQGSIVHVGDFNGDTKADLLVQAKPKFVMIDYDVAFPVPVYPPNKNGLVLSQGGSSPFQQSGVQQWSRMNNGVDWSPLTNTLVLGDFDGDGKTDILFQAKYSGRTNYLLTAAQSGTAVFPATTNATAISSNVGLAGDSSRLIAGNFDGSAGVGLYVQSLTPAGTNYSTNYVGASTTVSAHSFSTSASNYLSQPTPVATVVGRTVGTFDVSPTGAATYTIPIQVPPGPKGIQPNLALTYSSQSGDGTLGVGWNLSGLSAITRCNKTYAQDGAASGVTLSASDGYCLNGNRLRLQTGGYGAAGSTYFTELADFSRITANGTQGGGPQSFTIEAKDGLIYEYGTTIDSRVWASGSNVTPYQWLLNKVRDRAGNNYAVTYYGGEGPSMAIAVPASISYTAASAGSASYNYSVDFSYITRSFQNSNTRTATIYAYIAGYPTANPNLLSTISVSSGSTLVRKYTLIYDNGATTTAARLKTISECAGSAGTDCLSPTTITYQEGSAGTNSNAITVATDAAAVLAARDFNGDGRDDILYRASGDALYVSYGSASGYGTPVALGVTFAQPPLGYTTIQFADMFAAGRTDIMLPLNGVWWRYSWNGNALVGTSTGITYVFQKMGLWKDINGDGLPDLIYEETSNNYFSIKSRLNTSSGGVFSLSSTVNSAPQMIISYCSYYCWGENNYKLTDGFTPSNFYVRPTNTSSNKAETDINGDGRADVVLSWSYWSFDGDSYNWVLASQGSYAMLSDGTSFTTGPTTDNFKDFVHLNDDDCSDYILGLSSYSAVIADCNGVPGTTISLGYPYLGVADWDGDGREDVLVNTGAYVGVLYSTGTGLSPVVVTAIPVSNNFILDADGDGAWDIGSLTGSTISYNLRSAVGQNPPDVLASITDGYGVTSTPTYVSIAQSSYAAGVSPPTPPEEVEPCPLTVVGWASTTDGIGGTYTKTYSYQGARRDSQGRGFEGFQSVTVEDSRADAPKVTTYYKTAFPYTGMVYQQDVFQHNGTTLLSRTVNTPASLSSSTLDSAANNQRYFPYVSQSTVERYEVSGAPSTTTTTTYAYDANNLAYGNATTVTTAVTDKDTASPYVNQSWTTTITNTYVPDVGNWCVGLPTETSVQKIAVDSNKTRTVAYKLDGVDYNDYVKCRHQRIFTEPGNSLYQVTEVLGYDSFGNVSSNAITGINMPTRTTFTDWGATGQFPLTVTNPLGQQTINEYYFNLGVPKKVTDPNGAWVSWSYDNFGRKTREDRADGTATAWYRGYCSANGNCVNANNKTYLTAYAYNADGSIETDGSTYFDTFDRALVSSTRLPTGGYQRTEVQYDNLGRIKQQSIPGTNYWVTSAYDAVNRLTRQRHPIKAGDGPTLCDPNVSALPSGCQQTTIEYLGRTTRITDAQGKQTTKVTDVTGSLRQSKDHNGYYQNFGYDAFGSLVEVKDSPTNTLFSATYEYGVGAFQRTTSDRDLGNWTYTLNALGEVVSYTDAKNQSFAMTYDLLSRPVTRRDGVTSPTTEENKTIWTWGNDGTAGHNIGQLESVSSQGYAEIYTYDGLGRLSKRRIQSDATYDYDFTYGSNGQLETLTYPTSTENYRLKLRYQYQNGQLQQVADAANANTVFWQLVAVNTKGQIAQEALGNGIVTTRSFDAVTGRLGSIQSGPGGGASIQNESYLFDLVGNVTQRQNNNAPGLTETFCYDDVYRLSHTTATGSCNSTQVLTLQYDNGSPGGGNITSRNDVENGATWTYDPVKQHAVRTIGSNLAYTYDGNGNMLTRGTPANSIGWTSYNYPSVINGGGESVNLYYDANRQRYKQELYSNGSLAETTMYVGGLMEKVTAGSTTDYWYSIYAGGQVVAIMSRSGTSSTTRYMLEDHQGSVARITDNSGNLYVSESFNAFGSRRDPGTWSGSPSSSDLSKINGVSRQGYTGHTALGNLGLNHMNGRVQDAVTGRFLSADPYITEPGNTQNYNRYSYVYNNPLSLIDPSGFSTCSRFYYYVIDHSYEWNADYYYPNGTLEFVSVYESYECPTSPASDTAWLTTHSTPDTGSVGQMSGGTTEGPQTQSCPSGQIAYPPGSSSCIGIITGEPPLPSFVKSLSLLKWAKSLFSPKSKSVEEKLSAALSQKLDHVFKASHNLDPLAKSYGSREAALGAIKAATESTVRAKGITGVFETQVQVGNTSVTVTGNVVDDIVHFGNAWIP